MNVRQIMKQAQQMQEKMQREVAETVVEASVGGDMVRVRMRGTKQLVSLEIDPEVIDPQDPSMLQDLVLAAVNEATRKVDEELQERLGGMVGGGGLGGLLPGMMP